MTLKRWSRWCVTQADNMPSTPARCPVWSRQTVMDLPLTSFDILWHPSWPLHLNILSSACQYLTLSSVIPHLIFQWWHGIICLIKIHQAISSLIKKQRIESNRYLGLSLAYIGIVFYDFLCEKWLVMTCNILQWLMWFGMMWCSSPCSIACA